MGNSQTVYLASPPLPDGGSGLNSSVASLSSSVASLTSASNNLPLATSLIDEDFEEEYFASTSRNHRAQYPGNADATSSSSYVASHEQHNANEFPPSADEAEDIDEADRRLSLPSHAVPPPISFQHSQPAQPHAAVSSVSKPSHRLSILANVPLSLQQQYIRIVSHYLDVASLLAANRVNTVWKQSLHADEKHLMREFVFSPALSPYSPSSAQLPPFPSPVSFGTYEKQQQQATSPNNYEKSQEEEDDDDDDAEAYVDQDDVDEVDVAENEEAEPGATARTNELDIARTSATTTPKSQTTLSIVPPPPIPPLPPALKSPPLVSPPSVASITPLSPPVANEVALSDVEDDNESHNGEFVKPRFHAEPRPFSQTLAPSLVELALNGWHGSASNTHASAWHNSIELVVPATEGWIKAVSRSSLLRNCQRMTWSIDELTISTRGGPNYTVNKNLNADREAQTSRLTAEEIALLNTRQHYSSDLTVLLPYLLKFPHLQSLNLLIPLENAFYADGRGRRRLRTAFEFFAAHNLRELKWNIFPCEAPVKYPAPQDQKQSESQVGSSSNLQPALQLPISPSHKVKFSAALETPVDQADAAGGSTPYAVPTLAAEWGEEHRKEAFCDALVETLPLLSLTSLSLTRFSLPSGAALTCLLELPRLSILQLNDLPVIPAHLRLVRSLSTLRELVWSSWTANDIAFFAQSPPTGLQSLCLAYAQFDLISMKLMCKSLLASSLRSVTFDSCAGIDDATLGLFCSLFRQIDSFTLRVDSPIDTFQGAGLIAVASLPDLRKLHLQGNGIPLRNVFVELCHTLRANIDDAQNQLNNSSSDALKAKDVGLKQLILEQIQISAPLSTTLHSNHISAPAASSGSSISGAGATPVTAAFNLKYLLQVTSLTSLQIKRCSGTSNVLSCISLLPHLSELLLERRQKHAIGFVSAPGAVNSRSSDVSEKKVSYGIIEEEKGAKQDKKSSAKRSPDPSTPQVDAMSQSSSTPGSFGSLLSLSSLPRLERLVLNYSDDDPSQQSNMLLHIHQLQNAFLSKGKRVFIQWLGSHIPNPLYSAVEDEELQATVPE